MRFRYPDCPECPDTPCNLSGLPGAFTLTPCPDRGFLTLTASPGAPGRRALTSLAIAFALRVAVHLLNADPHGPGEGRAVVRQGIERVGGPALAVLVGGRLGV